MVAMVRMDFASWLNVALYTFANLAGPTPSRIAATIVARKHAVPDALSQLNAKTAGYGAGTRVTGGTRVIRLWSIGTLMPFNAVALRGRNDGMMPLVKRSSAPFTVTAPQARTNATSSMYGIHATS